MAPSNKTHSAVPSADDLTAAAADMEQFLAQVPAQPQTSFGSAVALSQPASSPASNPTAKARTPCKPRAKKAATSSSKKGNEQATEKDGGDEEQDGGGNEDAETEANDNNQAEPSSSSKGKSRPKRRGPGRPRKSKATEDVASDAVQAKDLVFYQVMSARHYPMKDQDRAEAQALHHPQSCPMPEATMDAFIYGFKLGKPWASQQRKAGGKEEEEEAMPASQQEAMETTVFDDGKAVETPTAPPVEAEAVTPEPSPDPALIGTVAVPSSLDTPSLPPAKETINTAEKDPSTPVKRKRDDTNDSEEEHAIQDQTPTAPFSIPSKRACLPYHELRAHFMNQAMPNSPAFIPRQLQLGPEEFASETSSDDDEGANSEASGPTKRSICSDHVQAQGIPLLSRILTDVHCHGAYANAEAANEAALHTIMQLATPPEEAQLGEQSMYETDILEWIGQQYNSQTENVEGEALVSMSLEPNITHYRWDFFALKVWVVKTVLGGIAGQRGHGSCRV